MSITASDLILLSHATCGVIGIAAALWVFVEALNATPQSAVRMRTAALIGAVAMSAAWILGGYWYVRFYPAEKAMILQGPWPFAHNIFMETKEHLFFITAILSFLLAIAVRDPIHENRPARKMVLSVAALVVVTGLAVEGAGAVIDHGAKVAFLRASAGGRLHQGAE
ncbi:MAG TPA: hypothetical protein VHC90_20385 [Bryobacteraceae bacterium]|nr:hypothetical protein [Bryobacteraceae bacterium]